MSQSILYQSSDLSVTLLDLPGSIAQAQATDQKIVSTKPLSDAFITPEPKASRRDKLLASLPASQREHDVVIQSNLQRSLGSLRQHIGDAPWCLQRTCIEQNSTNGTIGYDPSSGQLVEDRNLYHGPPLILAPRSNRIPCLEYLLIHAVRNPAHTKSVLHVGDIGSFNTPPNTTFVNATIRQGRPVFEVAFRCLDTASTPNGAEIMPAFHLMVLDPPWTNRSVRHSRVYRSAEYQQIDPFQETIPIVERYLRKDGFLAIWITNKAAIRAQVLRELDKIGLDLTEEWTWLKITSHGEPISPIDGLWRKPYETLLLFTHKSSIREVRLRTIVAVPDVHSRKPNLKLLFEALLPQEYQALELFARSLTAGWWSWGDEVLKFQHQSHWV